MKIHHSMADGLSLSAFFMQMSETFQVDSLPGLKPMTFLENFFGHLALFKYLPKFLGKSGKFKFETHILQNKTEMTGRKRIAFTQDIDLAQIKKYCKQNGCSINDYATSLIGTSIYELSETHKTYPTPDNILYGLIFSQRSPVKRL